MTPTYLFLFTIGPVQSFIAQARKTQDLFGGSRLLSELCREAIDFSQQKGVNVIFPLPNKKADSIPNRFVGTISINQGIDLQQIGEAIEAHVKQAFWGIAQQHSNACNPNELKGWKEQIENHLDVQWLFYEIENNDYANAYEEATQWLEAIKNTRIFKQNPESGRKCSLDGERNVKFYRPTEDEKDEKWLLKEKLFQKEDEVCIIRDRMGVPLSILQHGEGLSAVSFIKRAFKNGVNFPSTAAIAMMETIDRVWKKGVIGVNTLRAFRSEFGTDFDEQLYFEENLTSTYLRKNGYRKLLEERGKLDNIEKSYEQLRKYLKDCNLKFQKYYALILFDGDRMGKIVGGKYLTDKSKTQVFQSSLSTLLTDFATWASNYLNNPKGKTVYAGGDDFLGFINLNHLFEVMQMLRDRFDVDVNQKLKEQFSEVLGQDEEYNDFNFTFSAGVVIAHYKDPLGFVLKKAREMEKLAKDQGGRDAFALSVMKRSGETHETIFKWDFLPKLETILEELREEHFSDTFIDKLQRELVHFETDFSNKKTEFIKTGIGKKIAAKEIKRLVKRAEMVEENRHPLQTMADEVEAIFTESSTFENFAEAMNILQFLKRQINPK